MQLQLLGELVKSQTKIKTIKLTKDIDIKAINILITSLFLNLLKILLLFIIINNENKKIITKKKQISKNFICTKLNIKSLLQILSTKITNNYNTTYNFFLP